MELEIKRILNSFSTEVENIIQEEAATVAKDTSKKIRALATALYPSGQNFSTGKYARTWTYKKKKGGAVVCAKFGGYQLAHLLENGHKIVDKNGVVHGYWNPIQKHISPVEEEATKEFVERVKARINDIS